MKTLLAFLLFLLLSAPSDAAEPQTSPDSPWKLARAVLHAYGTQDREALRSFFCWDGTDSTIRAMTDKYIDDSMLIGVVSVTFKPLTGDDQVLAFGADSTTYRLNLEHVGYLCASAAQIYRWTFSVGRDVRGYRITLWAPAAKQISMADWNRPPSPREWLDSYYLDSSTHRPGYYNFKDSVEEASYYRDLLALAHEDEVSGRPDWMTTPQNRQVLAEILDDVRVSSLDGNSPSAFVAVPAMKWCLFAQADHFLQEQATDLLQRIQSPLADSLTVEVLTGGHPSATMIAQALSSADAHHLKIPKSTLLPFLRHYRPSIAAAARTLNDHLGYPAVRAPDGGSALRYPEVQGLLGALDTLFVPPLGKDAPFVTFTSHFKDSEDRTVRGWVVQEDSTGKVLMTTDGHFEYAPLKLLIQRDGSTYQVETSLTQTDLEAEAIRVLRLYDDRLSHSEPDRAWMPVATAHGALLGYRLYKTHRDSLAAQVFLRTLDDCDSDSELVDATQSTMGSIIGYRMLVAFAGDRDYAKTLEEAKLIASRYPHSYFAGYAKGLIRQLPLRMGDFTRFHLPSLSEWEQMKATMSRSEQIRFLCGRLRLLSDRRTGPQYAEAPGMDTLASLFGEGKTPVINPLMELQGTMDYRSSEKPVRKGGMQLTLSDVPVLAPYLLENWFFAEIPNPADWGLALGGNSERTLGETRGIIAGIVQSLLPQNWNVCRVEALDKLSEPGLKKRVDRIIAWAERNKDRDERAQVVDAVKDSRDYVEVWPMTDYLVDHQIKEAVPKLLSFMNTGIGHIQRNHVLSACRKIDAASCMPVARQYLLDRNYMARFNAGLIAYASGGKVDGLMAMAGAFEDDNGCYLTSGDPIEDAVSLLLSSHGADELEVARLALSARCLHDSQPENQWPLIQLFSKANLPDGLELFLNGLADSSVKETIYQGDTTISVQRRESVAKFVLENLVPLNQRVSFSYGDPADKRSLAVSVANDWLLAQIGEMKRSHH